MKDTELITQEGPSQGAVFIGLRAGGPAGWARWREGAGAGGVRRDERVLGEGSRGLDLGRWKVVSLHQLLRCDRSERGEERDRGRSQGPREGTRREAALNGKLHRFSFVYWRPIRAPSGFDTGTRRRRHRR